STNGKLQVLAGTAWVEPCDMVIKAIGEQKQVSLLKRLFPALELDQRGAVVHDPDTGQTNLPRLFAGGDCANGGQEVVNAVAEGKKAARAIHVSFAGQAVSCPPHPSPSGRTLVPSRECLARQLRPVQYVRSDGVQRG